MGDNESTAKLWSHTQAYGLAVICLLAVIGIGYLAQTALRPAAVTPYVARPAAAHASRVYITSGQKNEGAANQVEPLLAQPQKSPDNPFLLSEIGKIYYQERQFHMAAKYYEDSVMVKPDAVVFVKLGGAYHFDGDDEKAIGAWNQALRLEPNNPDALFNIGFVKWNVQGNRKAAIDAWQKLLKTNPDHPKRAQVEELLAQVK
jgi:cytochrome c-type biogenesis protein CcmH/NrfG